MIENLASQEDHEAEVEYADNGQHVDSGQVLVADSFSAYMLRASRHQLLGPEREASLGKQVLAGHAARELLAEQDTSDDTGETHAYDKAQLEQIQELGRSAVDTLVTSNLKLVVSAAKKFKHKHEQVVDVIQDGNLGLMRAAEKFDPRKGYRFTTYASWWIRQSIERGRPHNTNRDAARFPMHIRQELQKVNKAIHALDSKTLQKGNYLGTVAETCELPEERVKELLLYQRSFSYADSLDRPISEESDTTLADIVHDRTEVSPESEALSGITREGIYKELALLDERQKTVIALRFGLVDGDSLTLEAIGQQIGLTRERVRQIQNEALKVLRKSLKGRIRDTT